MHGAGLVGREIRPDAKSLSMGAGLEYSLRWLRRRRPAAVLTYACENAVAIMYAARSLGLNVPEDLSIMTFDERLCDSLGTNIDTMILPEAELGRRAVENLLQKTRTRKSSCPANRCR